MTDHADVAVIGAGAAGLMAAVWAGRTGPGRTVVVLDGARTIGRKILIAGGGRCNVTHDVVTPADYAGSTQPAIRNVLRRFDVAQTVAFFAELGVTLKREPTGKLFPTTDRARTVLDALLGAARDAGVDLRHPCRVAALARDGDRFRLTGDWGALTADRVVVATGGRSVPQTGSDGHGYALVAALGHTLTPRILPALVPLLLPRDHFLCGLAGVALPATLTVTTAAGKRLKAFTDAVLCTHFGLSGPVVLDISRYYLDAVADDPGTHLTVNWLPGVDSAELDRALQTAGRTPPATVLRQHLPERMARALVDAADAADPHLTRAQRRRLVQKLCDDPLPVTGSRGFNYAEVTAGGVPLRELSLKTLESRVCPGLYLCGEICDVDGRIGGFNFQWAWASGYVVGTAV